MNILVIVDEGLLSFRDKAQTITGHASLSPLQGMGREAGISFYVTTLAPQLTDAALRSNVYLTAATRPANGEDARHLARTLTLTDDQTTYVAAMPRGEVVLRLPRIPHPILATFDPIEKTVNEGAYEAARERTMRFCNDRLRPTASTPHAEPPSPARLVLNAHEQQLLEYVAKRGTALTTSAFAELGVHPQAGTRAKKKLLALTLIEEERIIVHRRRGGTAVAIRPTRAGYDRAGIKRPPMRTGSLQHEWLVRSLAARIPKANIELSVAGKACDVLLAYDAGLHERLATFAGIAPADAEIIAIEVEVSRPDKTGPRNAERNNDVGIHHTILATMTPLRAPLPGVVVVDVFALLEALG